MYLTYRLCTEHSQSFLPAIHQQYSHVLVDEFQDLNGVQTGLLTHLASHGRVTVVGDFDQVYTTAIIYYYHLLFSCV